MKYAVFDAHCDTALELWSRGETLKTCTTAVDLLAADYPAYGQFFAICPLSMGQGSEACGEIFSNVYGHFLKLLQQPGSPAALIRDRDAFARTWEAGKCAAFLSLEGAEGIGCDPGRLEDLHAMGVRMVNLTWNENNALAGCAVKDGGGLTAQGREFVRRAQRLGILLDVSHLSERAFWDLMDLAEEPVVASHSNSAALCPHRRNLTDEQFRAICETGGFVGINFYTPFLAPSGKADLDTVRCHMDHFLSLGGFGHVALGGDLDGCDALPVGLSGLAGYAALADHLEQAGFSETYIQEIYSNTIKRVVKSCIM